ncbi:protein kinase domain-containing protein [Coleofasciculus sp. E1-EBD-02]|uniref:protein kinase domain-containing protein n=1 Tax=Coleofasciculus sp. E1-EBD-02 TaxID=3068481 RepID=UPI0032FC1B68
MPKPSYLLTEEGVRKIKKRFSKICQKSSPSQEDIAVTANLHRDTIRKLLNRTGGVNKRTLEDLCSPLGWNIEDLKEDVDYRLCQPTVSDSDAARQSDRSKKVPQHQAPTPSSLVGTTIGGRYTIIKHLGSGEFGDTYLSEDLHTTGKPQCAIKQLRIQCGETARKALQREVYALLGLKNHNNQIAKLLAYFDEEDYSYLVYEFIQGNALSQELIEGRPWIHSRVIKILQDLLNILDFIHEQKIIHRNINPKNLIRRSLDNQIILINFSSVKEISTGQTRTFAGTQGYMPSEQSSGLALPCSDIYAVGTIGIQAIIGINPTKFKVNHSDGNIIWRDKAQVNLKFAEILDKMVRWDFKERYQSAAEALQDFQNL